MPNAFDGTVTRRPLLAAAAALPLAVLPRAGRAQGAPAERTVVIDTGQRTWRVPYGYLSIRPPAGALEPVNRWSRFSFAFWMPDGRPPGTAGQELAWLRPQEPGRPPPGPDEFVFIANLVEPFDTPLQPPRPAQMLANALSIPGTDRHDYRERWGMVEATPKPGEGELSDKYLLSRFHRDPAGATEAYARCSRPHPTDNGICSGRASLAGLDVSFHVQLPKDRMDRFADALDVARRLLLGWAA